MKKIYTVIRKIIGWKIEGQTDYGRKCVVCVAPHTSNWDLFLGKILYGSLGRQSSFLMKKAWFFFPLNFVFKAVGGIPVNRGKKSSLTDQLAELFAKRDDFQLAITPEGTRKKTNEWKKGFYYIALEAKVPIIVVALDYPSKTATFKAIFHPTGNVDKDIEEIKSYYEGVAGKHASKFAL